VEVYALPPLTEQDQAAVKQAEALAPLDTGARIDLSLERVSTPTARDAAGGAATDAASGAAATAASATGGDSSTQATEATTAGAAVKEPGAPAVEQGAPSAASAAATAASTSAVVLGDPEPGTGRKRPTLYGSDETPAESPSK
jgi:hypothetical protein